MNRSYNIQFYLAVLVLMSMLSVSCSKDEFDVLKVNLIPSDVSGSTEKIVQTKADAGYYDYNPTTGSEMGVFATGGTNGTVQGTFEYAHTGWNSNVMLEAGRNYNLYVYSPKLQDVSFNDGNVLTLNNLSVSGEDVLIIEGVAKQNSSVIAGNFSFTMSEVPQGDSPKDYVDIKMDHLFAQIFLDFAIEDPGNDPFKFGNLRKIKITKAELATTNSSNATITFNNSNSQQPFSVSWSELQNSETKVYATINGVQEVQNNGGLMITPEYQSYGGGFAIPTVNGTKAELWLRVTYNVYDLNDILVREGDISENRLTMSVQELIRGTVYRKKIFIQPTYIYSLTDGDQLTLKF